MNKILLKISLVFAFIYSFAFSQESDVFNMSGRPLIPNTVDPHNLGMGKTGVVHKKSSVSLFLNPSCLAAMDSLSITTGVDFNFGFIDNPKLRDSLESLNANFKSSNTPFTFNVSHLAIGLPIHFKNSVNPFSIGLGLGYHSPYNLNNTYTSTVKFPTKRYEFRDKMKGGIRAVSLGLGLGILDKYFLGIALNKSIINRFRIEKDETISPKNGNNIKNKSNYILCNDAFYSTFGAMVQLIPELRIGMKIVSKFKWDFDTYEFELDDSLTQFNEGRIDKEVTMPALYALGVAYTIIPAITLTVEYQTRLFEYFLVNGEEFVKEDDIDNGFSFNMGTEIKAGIIPIRLGMFIESIPYTDYHYTPYKRSDKPIKMFGLTSGFGVPIKVLNLNIGFSWSYYDKEDYDTTSTGINYYYKHTRNNFSIDIGISSQFGVTSKEVINKVSPKSIPSPKKDVKSIDSTVHKKAVDTSHKVIKKETPQVKPPVKSDIQAEKLIEEEKKIEKDEDRLIEEEKNIEKDTVTVHWQLEEKPIDLRDSTDSKDSLQQNKKIKNIKDSQLSTSKDTSSTDDQTITSKTREELKESSLPEEKRKTNKSDNLWADDENLFETPSFKAGDSVSITLTNGKVLKGLIHDLDEEKYVLDIQGEKITVFRVAVQSIEKR